MSRWSLFWAAASGVFCMGVSQATDSGNWAGAALCGLVAIALYLWSNVIYAREIKRQRTDARHHVIETYRRVGR